MPEHRTRSAQTRLSTVLAAALLASLGLAPWIAKGQPQAPAGLTGYHSDLGDYVLRVPAGTHVLTLPLVPQDAADILTAFGPEALGADSLESWDAPTRQWKAYFPQRPEAVAGERKLHGQVVRIATRAPLLLAVHGTPPKDGWQPAFSAAAAAEFLGPVSVVPLKLADVVGALEAGGSFLLARDGLERWDLDSARWVPIAANDLQLTIPPGTAFHRPQAQPSTIASSAVSAASGSTVASGSAGGSPLVAQATPALDGALDPRGNTVSFSAYPKSGPAPAGMPYTLTGYRYDDTKPRPEGIGNMSLPDDLLAMTDLPPVVPVRVFFTRPPNPRPMAVEVLGITQMKIGGQQSVFQLSAIERTSAMDLKVSTDGKVFGAGAAAVPALGDAGLDISGPVTLTAQPMSVYFDPQVTTDVVRLDGSKLFRSGPVLDVLIGVSEHAQAFRRWGTSASPMPPESGTSWLTSQVQGTDGWWVAFDPDVGKLIKLDGPGKWMERTLPATLRTTDGRMVHTVDGQVSSAAITFGLLGGMGGAAPAGWTGFTGFGTNGNKVTFWPSGLTELQIDKVRAWRVWGDDVSLCWKAANGKYETGITPKFTLETKVARGTTVELKLQPIFWFRGLAFKGDPTDDDGWLWEELMLTIQPKIVAGLKMDAVDFSTIGDLPGRFAGARDWAKGLFTGGGTDRTAALKDIGSALGENVGLKVGVATVVQTPDVGGVGTHRISLYGTGELFSAAEEGGGGRSNDWEAHVGGAWEDANVDKSGGASSPIGLKLDVIRSKRSEGMTEFRNWQLNFGYRFPEDLGWAPDRAAAGQINWTREWLPGGAFTNRFRFQMTDAVAVTSKLPIADLFQIGADTKFSTDMTDFTVDMEAERKTDAKVARRGQVSLSMFMGAISTATQSAGDTSGADTASKGILFTITKRWEGEPQVVTPTAGGVSPTAVSVSATSGEESGFKAMFQSLAGASDPAVLAWPPKGQRLFPLEIEILGQNTEWVKDHLRFDRLAGTLVNKTDWSAEGQLGFRIGDSGDWAHCSLLGQKRPMGWRIAAEVGDLKVKDDFDLTNAYLELEKPNDTSPVSKSFGAEIGFGNFDAPLLRNSEVRLGFDVDLDQRTGAFRLAVPFQELFGQNASFKLKATDVSGTVDLKTKPWSIAAQLGADFSASYLEGRTARVLFSINRSTTSTSVTAEVKDGLPDIPIPPDGYVRFPQVGLGWDTVNKLILSGQAAVHLTTSMANVGKPILTIPGDMSAVFTAIGKRISVTATAAPPLKLQVIDGLGLSIKTLSFSKASPWAFGGDAAIETSAGSQSCSVAYDANAGSLTFRPPASATIGFPLGGGFRMSVTQFSLAIFRTAGGAAVQIAGRATVSEDKGDPKTNRSWAGTLAMSVDRSKNVSAALTNLSSGDTSGMALPSFGGITVAMKGLAISSTIKPGSSARTTAVTAAVGITLDADVFGPLGGTELIGTISKDTQGNLILSVTSTLPSLALGPLPFEIALRALQVIKNSTTGETGVQGRAILKVLRPINSILGQSGDTPFVFDGTIGVRSKAGEKKKQIYVSATFTPSLKFDFNMLGARGNLEVPGITVDTQGALDLSLFLHLYKPTTNELTITAIVDKGKVRFSITSVPELVIDLSPLFKLNFHRLAYDQAFPGFMGVGAHLGMNVGIDLFGFGLQFGKDDPTSVGLLYILPSSFPPFGFPFFDEISANLRFFGFGARGAIALPPPNLGVQDAINLVMDLGKAFGQENWDPLQDFLREKMKGETAIFRGPGVGNLYMGLPMVLRDVIPKSTFPTQTWFPDDPDLRQQVIEIALLTKMYFASDLFGGQLADALVSVLKIASIVCKVFTDPVYIVNLVPEKYRAAGFDIDLGGILAAAASYALLTPTIYTNDGTSEGLPKFDDLCTLAGWVDNEGSSGLARIPRIVMADAMRMEPLPVKARPFSFASDAGTTFSGSINDEWIPLRPFVKTTLDVSDYSSPPDAAIDADKAGVLHLRKMVDEGGGVAQKGNVLASNDGKDKLTVMGSSASFRVLAADGKKNLFFGSVPLGWTTTQNVATGMLEMTSQVKIESRKLVSEVVASITPKDGGTRQDLGSVSKTILRDLDNEKFVCSATDGRIVGWIGEYFLDDKKTMKATFTDYGTAKFTGPNKEYTNVFKGALLSDIRNVLRVFDSFKGSIFDYDVSPYVLGLKMWSRFKNDPQFAGRVDQISTNGRTISIRFRSPVNNATLEMRLILEEAAYYMTANRDPKTGEIGGLEGAKDIDKFRIEEDKIYAEPFTIQLNKDQTPVRDLIVFDGSPEVQKMLDRCEKQKTVLMKTDLQQFAELGLSVGGDPLIVKSLRVELDLGQVRAVVRPKSILLTKLEDGYPLINVTNGLIFANVMTQGPYEDKSTYPSEAGTYLTLSNERTGAATTVFDLHESLGSNVLIRTVTVNRPPTIAGDWTEMAHGQLQGAFNAGGEGVQVTADSNGMVARMKATPDYLTMRRDMGGSMKGAVPFSGADRTIDFYWDKKTGKKLEKFKYPTGQVEPGGFEINASMKADLALFAVSMVMKGEIKASGYFRFAGDINLSILSKAVYGAHYEISSTEGFYIWGNLDMLIGTAAMEGRLHAKSGARFSGHFTVLPGGTGIDAQTTVDTNADEKLKIHGDVKVANSSIATMDIHLNGSEFAASWGVGGSWAGVSMDLKFRYSGGFGIEAKGRAWLRILFGTIRVGLGFGIRSDGTISVCIGPLEISINLGTFDFDVDLC